MNKLTTISAAIAALVFGITACQPDRPVEIPLLEMSEISAEVTTSSSIVFVWETVPNASHYEIDFNDMGVRSVMEPRFEAEGLKPGTEYTIGVRAISSVNEWNDSEEAFFAVKTLAASTPGNPDNPGTTDPENPDNPDNPGTTDPVDPTPANRHYGSWYEMPVINDADGNGVDDNDQDIYYATHICAGNEKAAGGRPLRNYTVCFSGEHHCPLWVAAPRHSCLTGSANRTNAYARDPDIPSNLQYSSKSIGGDCNKGHMLGSAERTSSSATNRQVFYYTNIAPQLSSGFNTGGGGWNTLEDWMDGQVPTDTLYEVVGCYFDRYKDAYGYEVAPKRIEFGGRSDVSMPTMFYYAVIRTKSGNTRKALKDCSADELKCVAFVRVHTNSLKGQKVTSKELMSISDLEKITGFTYFPNVPNAPKSSFKASDWGL